MTTKLGALQASGRLPAPPETPAAAAEQTRLAQMQALGGRGELVSLPILGKAWIELAGHELVNRLEAEVFGEMTRLGFDYNVVTALTYEAERAMRTLCECVRDADDHAKPFGTLEQWRKVDADLINACNLVYGDVRNRLDPISVETLTDDDVAAILFSLEKKSPMGLRSFGVAKLSHFLLSMADRLAISPTARSSTGPGPSTTEVSPPSSG